MRRNRESNIDCILLRIERFMSRSLCKISQYMIFMLIVFLLSPVKAKSVYVPINHWVYDYLERMEAKRVVKGLHNSTKPMTREAIVGYLAQIDSYIKAGEMLNDVEIQQYKFLVKEFEEEFKETGLEGSGEYRSRLTRIKDDTFLHRIIPDFIYGNGRDFFSYSYKDFSVYFDPILRRGYVYEDTDSLSGSYRSHKFTNGVKLWGRIGDYVAFYIDARDNKEWGTEQYPPGNYTLPGLGFVRATSPDYIYHDETDAYLTAGTDHVSVTYGKFENSWGNGRTGNLILGNAATTYDQFKIDVSYKYFHFTSLYAYLIDYKDFKGDSLQERKYMAGHRLEFSPWNWIDIGLSETVVFKGRSFEPSYANPFMFLRSAEHYLGSPDNMLMGLDIKLIPFKNVILNGELLIDDLTTGKLGTGWYGNKIGYMIGAFIAEPMGMGNLDMWIEYTRIEPYVYSHINSLTYSHYATGLGHPSGPNSDMLVLQINYRPQWRLLLNSRYYRYRHGDNASGMNVGGDIDAPFGMNSDEYPEFLGGLRRDKQGICISATYEIFRWCYLKVNYSHAFASYDKELGESERVNKNVVGISLGLNY